MFYILRLTERFNQTLVTHLMKSVNEQCDNWDEHVQPILFAYRVNRQESTKMSPFEILYGQKAKLPVDLDENVGGEEWSEPIQDEVMNRVKKITTAMQGSRGEARANIEAAQSQQKRKYDMKHAPPTYNVGDRVLKYNRRRDTRMGDKLVPRYSGPYTIHESIGHGVYRIKEGDKILKQAVNAINLKMWREQVSTSQSASKKQRRSLSPQPLHELSDKASSPPSDSGPTEGNPVLLEDEESTCMVEASLDEGNLFWKKNFQLRNTDSEDILKGAWVNDIVIDGVNKLVSDQLGGSINQSTVMAQSVTGFDQRQEEGIQILFDNNHWIAVACMAGQILIGDSLRRTVSPNLATQIKQLYPSLVDSNGNLPVTFVECAKQGNGNDCGVYAAAFAFEWALSQGDLAVDFETSQMRPHLRRCLDKEEIVPFPRKMRTRGRKYKHLPLVKVSC